MSIGLVKQNDGTWVEKHQRFFIQRLQTFFFILSRLLRFLTFSYFFWNVFYIYGRDDVSMPESCVQVKGTTQKVVATDAEV